MRIIVAKSLWCVYFINQLYGCLPVLLMLCLKKCDSICMIFSLEGFPSITALKFNGALQLGVGTATGQVLLYDIRSNKPFYVKDHMYGLPIKDVEFHYQQDLVFSMDSSILKIWDKNKVNNII